MIQGIDDRITVAFLSALLTFAVTRAIDGVRKRDDIAVFAKGAAIPLIAVARSIESHAKMLGESLASDDDRLRAFFKFVVDIAPPSDVAELRAHVRTASRCPHDVLVRLRACSESVHRVRERFELVRQTLEMSTNLRRDSEALHSQIAGARSSIRAALEVLRKISSSDTKREIVQLLREIA